MFSASSYSESCFFFLGAGKEFNCSHKLSYIDGTIIFLPFLFKFSFKEKKRDSSSSFLELFILSLNDKQPLRLFQSYFENLWINLNRCSPFKSQFVQVSESIFLESDTKYLSFLIIVLLILWMSNCIIWRRLNEKVFIRFVGIILQGAFLDHWATDQHFP